VRRDFDRLRQGPFDLLVIGGGIYGAWTALDASLRGLRTALVEKGDWASGTSSVSSKLVHGGLRYLEHLRFGLVIKSLRERALLASIAPHRVRPARFIIPRYRSGRVGPLRLSVGLAVYDLLSAGDRPGGRPRRLDREVTLRTYPFLQESGLVGSFSYGDAVTDDARFTLEVVEAAMLNGASALNYAKAVGPLSPRNCAGGAVVRDLVGGASLEVRASVVVNTAGPWVADIAGCSGVSGRLRLTKGVHLLLPALPSEDAFLFLARQDARVFFLIPWYGRTLVGTTDTDYGGDPETASVTAADVDYLLTEISHVLSGSRWDRNSICGATAGLRTLLDVPGAEPSALSREWRLLEPVPGLLVSVGGKFTSARADAAVIVDRAARRLGRRWSVGAPTTATPLPRSPATDPVEWLQEMTGRGVKLGLDGETSRNGALRYGTSVSSLFALVRAEPALGKRLLPDLPFCRAEIAFGAAREMAVHLEDILRRRLPLMLLTAPNRGITEEAASLAAPILGWNNERRRAESEKALKAWGTLPGGKEGA
jgi:glycerol-3-phosphate dehydrogenase